MAQTYRHILAIKLADLGDLLAATPALQALRAAHPEARIDLLVPPTSASLLEGAPYLDRILTYDKYLFDSLRGLLSPAAVLSALGFLVRLRRQRYDALVVFHHFTTRWGSIKFRALALAAGSPVRAGLDNGRGGFLTLHAIDRGFGAAHEADYWLAVAGLLGADPRAGWQPSVPLSDEHRAEASRLLQGIGNRHAMHDTALVALHPGAGRYSLARMWPNERFAEVARALVDLHNADVLVVGGPDEVELAAEVVVQIERPGRIHTFAGRTSIHETAALIERCDLFVGNDSGPMHLAAAVGTPVVAVFGPSNWAAWGPYVPPDENSPHTIVRRDLPCMPCFYRAHSLGLRDGCGPRPCLTVLAADPVLTACTAALDRLRPGRNNGKAAAPTLTR
jgi:lipopolysaccharide heptosyltransferase II